MNRDKLIADAEYLIETKEKLDLVYNSKMITKEQYEKALEDLIKPYK